MAKKTPNMGDLVEIKTESEILEGKFIPSQKKDIITIKLSSGYNIGIDKKKIKSIKVIKQHKEKKEELKKIKSNKQLPTIAILHTGGTISSHVSYETGAVSAKFTPEEIMSMFPEIRKFANIKSKLIRNMWSDDMRFAHYNIIAKEIQKEIKEKVDGIIITHGTDTLHYTSAALSFILEDLSIPVILVGAQRSSDRGSSDAALNLINATYFISKTDFAGVAICMHENNSDENCLILPALKTRKMHTSRRDAFKPINSTPIAKVNFRENKINFFKKYNKKNNKTLNLKLFKEDLKVAILKIHTNMYPEQFLAYKNYKGLVIEGTGLGHTPGDVIDNQTKTHKKIIDALKTLINSGTIVVMSSQTIFGRIDMNVYSKGRNLKEIGIIGNYSDMTPETTFIKLAWLLSNYKKDEVKKLITKNIRGEISKRSVLSFI